jgi:hypothetical protein
MRKILLLLVGTAVLAVPTVSLAGHSSSSTSASGVATADATGAAKNPTSICKTKSFAVNGGKNRGTSANAFGRCVSTIAMHKAVSETEDTAKEETNTAGNDGSGSAENHGTPTANPAKTCKAMRANDAAHFQATYGTRPNAFGKCVASHAADK